MSSATARFCAPVTSTDCPLPTPAPCAIPCFSFPFPLSLENRNLPLPWCCSLVYSSRPSPSSPNSLSPPPSACVLQLGPCPISSRHSPEDLVVPISEAGNWSSAMASNVWHNWTTLRFLSGFLPFLEAGAGWFVQVREALKGKVMGYYYNNPMRRRPAPHVSHKIKMASMHMSMDEISKTYKITPVRR